MRGKKEVVSHLSKIASLYLESGDLERYKSFDRAAATIKSIQGDLRETIISCRLQWIGQSIKSEILEFLDNGKTSREVELLNNSPRKLLEETAILMRDFISELEKSTNH